MAQYKPTIVFDFDGVIHSYTSGWKGIDVIPDPPVKGIKEAIDKIREDYKVVVVSTRCEEYIGMTAVIEYLAKNGIKVDGVQATKPPAIIYVDDRAVCFQGDPSILYHQIKSFIPWTQKIRGE